MATGLTRRNPGWTPPTRRRYRAAKPVPAARTFEIMNYNSLLAELATRPDRAETSPVLLVPYMWIGDFVRCHTVVRVLKDRWPNRPVDVLTTSLCAPLVDYMPGVRQGIVWDLPRSELALGQQRALAARLREQHYGASLVMPRTFKSTIAPWLAGIPQRTGFIGEVRFGLLERLAPRRTRAAADDRPLCGAGAAGRYRVADGLAGAATGGAAGRDRRLAAGPRPDAARPWWRWRRARSAPPSAGAITPRRRGAGRPGF